MAVMCYCRQLKILSLKQLVSEGRISSFIVEEDVIEYPKVGGQANQGSSIIDSA
jgi:hypothetical protein